MLMPMPMMPKFIPPSTIPILMFMFILMLMSMSNGLDLPGVRPADVAAGTAATVVDARPIFEFALVLVRDFAVVLRSSRLRFEVDVEEGVGVEADGREGKEAIAVGVIDPLNPDQNES